MAGRGIRASLDAKSNLVDIATQRYGGDNRGGLYPGQLPHAMQDIGYKRRPRLRLSVFLAAHREVQRQDILKMDSRIHAIEQHKSFDHEARPDQKNQGQSNFGYY